MAEHSFIQSSDVQDYLARARKIKEKNIRFSDIEDAQGHQYVDLVQEGGGVLGVALVGYTHILETAGIRFFNLAGTSAGAINTMMMAALGPIEKPKSEKILDILSRKDLFDLVDGNKAIKKLVQKAIRKESGLGWSIALNAIRIYRTLKKRLGINPGNDFENWITDELSKHGINTVGDLSTLRQALPAGLKNITDGNIENLIPKLAIISSDITTHTKVEFPRMAGMYWHNHDDVPPAKLVRASMSIPFFFEPFEVSDLPDTGTENHPLWDKYAKYSGPVPGKVRFVDGGMLSNFPINVFHRTDGKVPRMPTLGVRLSTFREGFSNTDSLMGFSGAMISTMRQIHDYDFLMKNPDYRELICRINADEKFNWLDFQMSKEDQVKLFELGAKKAIEFLESFNWQEYKELRSSMNTRASLNQSASNI